MIKQMKDDDVERVARAIEMHRTPAYADDKIWAEDIELQRSSINPASSFNLARVALSAMPERELLREALEALTPFASDADLWSGSDSFTLVEAAPGYSDALNVGDLRRARAAADKIRARIKEGEAS